MTQLTDFGNIMKYLKFDYTTDAMTSIDCSAIPELVKDLKMTIYPNALTVWRGIGYIIINMHDNKKEKLQTA